MILPVAAGNYGELQAIQGKVLYHKHARHQSWTMIAEADDA